jgi:hypothetical protein
MNRIPLWTVTLLVTIAISYTAPEGHSAPTSGTWYVAPQGRPTGLGTLASPWDLATALAGGPSRNTVLPGDTILVRGGTYAGSFRCDLKGTEAAPIVVRNFAGERVILDNARFSTPSLHVPANSRYVWIWGLELVNSDTSRLANVGGNTPPIQRGRSVIPMDVMGANIKVINCIVRDGSNGIGVWNNTTLWGKAKNAEVYGCLVFNNGWHAPDRGNGHGIYAQNSHSASDPSLLQIKETMIWNNFGYGLHAYSGNEAAVNNMLFEGVISFNNGSPVGSYRRAPLRSPNIAAVSTHRVQKITIRNCYLYHPSTALAEEYAASLLAGSENTLNTGLTLENSVLGGGGLLMWLQGWKGAVVNGNLFAGRGSQTKLVRVDTHDQKVPTDYLWNDNTYLDETIPLGNGGRYTFRCAGVRDQAPGGTMTEALRYSAWRSGTGFDSASAYAATVGAGTPNRVVLRPNVYERGRAHVVIYNWDRRSTVDVDLSASGLANGQAFEIRNVQNYFGAPAARGAYNSARPIVSLPMTDTVVTPPTGFEQYPIPSTLPEFGAFVLIPG